MENDEVGLTSSFHNLNLHQRTSARSIGGASFAKVSIPELRRIVFDQCIRHCQPINVGHNINQTRKD